MSENQGENNAILECINLWLRKGRATGKVKESRHRDGFEIGQQEKGRATTWRRGMKRKRVSYFILGKPRRRKQGYEIAKRLRQRRERRERYNTIKTGKK